MCASDAFVYRHHAAHEALPLSARLRTESGSQLNVRSATAPLRHTGGDGASAFA